MDLSQLRTARFWKHYAAMVAAMLVGMGVLMPLAHVGPLRDAVDTPIGSSLFMATTMSVGMTAYMSWRRHAWRSILAMDAAMYASFVAFFPALWAGLVGGETVLVAGHVVMLPAMAAVMLVTHRENCSTSEDVAVPS